MRDGGGIGRPLARTNFRTESVEHRLSGIVAAGERMPIMVVEANLMQLRESRSVMPGAVVGHDAFAGALRGDRSAAMYQIGVPDQHVSTLGPENLLAHAILD